MERAQPSDGQQSLPPTLSSGSLRFCTLDVTACRHHLSDYVGLLAQGRWITPSSPGSRGPPTTDVLLRRWERMRTSATVFVAETGEGRLVGAVTAVREVELMGCRYHIENVVTDRAHRRGGVASRLMQHTLNSVAGHNSPAAEAVDAKGTVQTGAVAAAPDAVVSYVFLSASKYGPRRLYRRCGFQPFGIQLQRRCPEGQADSSPTSSPAPSLSSSTFFSSPPPPSQPTTSTPPSSAAPLVQIRRLREEDGPSLFALLQHGVEVTGWGRPFVRPPGVEPPRGEAALLEEFGRSQLSFLDHPQVRSGQKQLWVAVDGQRGNAVLAACGLFFEDKLTEGGGRPTAHVSGLYHQRQLADTSSASSRLLLGELMSSVVGEAAARRSYRLLLRCSHGQRRVFLRMGWTRSSQQMYRPVNCGEGGVEERRELARRPWTLWLASEVITRVLPIA